MRNIQIFPKLNVIICVKIHPINFEIIQEYEIQFIRVDGSKYYYTGITGRKLK